MTFSQNHPVEFDIFGIDATIAENLESSGLPLGLHISEHTKALLEEDGLPRFVEGWNISDYTEKAREKNPYLIEKNVNSFLIEADSITADLVEVRSRISERQSHKPTRKSSMSSLRQQKMSRSNSVAKLQRAKAQLSAGTVKSSSFDMISDNFYDFLNLDDTPDEVIKELPYFISLPLVYTHTMCGFLLYTCLTMGMVIFSMIGAGIDKPMGVVIILIYMGIFLKICFLVLSGHFLK